LLHIHIPSLPQKSYEYRRGDSTVVYDDDKHAILIDGGEGDLWKKMRKFLEDHELQHVTFVLSHWHPDHDCALRSALESSYVIVDRIYCPPIHELQSIPDGTGDYRRAAAIIGLARNLGKEIVYIPASKTQWIKVGSIRMWLWRRKANRNDYVNYQVNNTSISAYCPDLAYWSMGDAITSAEVYLNRFKNRKIIGFKVGHHGNACSEGQCDLLEARGAKICFYNDWEPSGTAIGGTNFSKYGARNCARHFVTLRPFQDIDIQSNGKTVVWKQGGKTWTFALVDEPKQEAPAHDQAQTAPKLRDMSTLFGIDTSYANGAIDWDKVAPHIDFAIIQCGFGQDRTSQDDKQFKRAAEACERLGIPYGIYLYSYAKNQTMAEGEARHAIRLAKGRQLSLPIYYDLEESSLGSVAASNMRAFGMAIENAGYWCGVYSGEYYYSKNLSYITAYTRWIARYNSNNGKATTKPSTPNVAIWQYSSRGKVAGVSGYVDVNISYFDLIKSVTGKDYIQAARDVWAGKYGTDEERTQKLKEEGFDPRIVQHFVNRLKA
jgi:GH25 family lysozyme M1 (1,4-beta-N-acetylmuramidase)/ribonuclease BN (tRNA processing enzyme)